VRYTLENGKELTSEEQEAARLRIEAASKRSYVYDPDCPLLTPKQLSEFRPVHFTTLEERTQAMRKAGIDQDMKESKASLETVQNGRL
jgi:hypothetical protein